MTTGRALDEPVDQSADGTALRGGAQATAGIGDRPGRAADVRGGIADRRSVDAFPRADWPRRYAAAEVASTNRACSSTSWRNVASARTRSIWAVRRWTTWRLTRKASGRWFAWRCSPVGFGLLLAWWSLKSVKLTLIVFGCGLLSGALGSGGRVVDRPDGRCRVDVDALAGVRAGDFGRRASDQLLSRRGGRTRRGGSPGTGARSTGGGRPVCAR